MKKGLQISNFRLQIFLLLLLAAAAVGAITYTSVRPIFRAPAPPVNSLDGYTLVYIQIFSYDGTMVWDATANSAAGGMAALASATYANTKIEVTKNTDFNIWQLKIPDGTTLPGGPYTWRMMGSADATADKDDDFLGGGNLPWTSRGGNAGLDTMPGLLPMPLE